MRFKNLEWKPKKESHERTISASGGLGLSQIILELDTGDMPAKTVSREGEWTLGGVPARTLGPKGG